MVKIHKTIFRHYGIHLLYLVPLVVFLSFLFFHPAPFEAIKSSGIYLEWLQGIFLTLFLWLGCKNIANYLWKKYPWEVFPRRHLVLEIVAILIYTSIILAILVAILYSFGYEKKSDDLPVSTQIFITYQITFFITALHEAVFFYQQWKHNFSKSIRLEKDNLEARYQALKAQINPHFLFNSLNSLLTYVGENQKATDYVQSLSDFLRYVLKSNEREVVLLREEIEMLEKYIFLQTSRFGSALIISLDVPEKYFHYSIPPLVLQMLLENSIKHNIISKSKPLTISIYIEDERVIVVQNTLQKKHSRESTGHGLKNISERYAFLSRDKVQIKETSDIFKVSVPLVLANL